MERLKPLALLLLRVALGVVFMYHGYPKLFAHAHPPIDGRLLEGQRYLPYVGGVIEFAAGAMLLVGFFTTCAGLALAIEQAVILWKFDHFFAHPRAVYSYQLTIVCLAGAFMLAALGAGPFSLDAARGKGSRRSSPSKPKRRE